MNSQNNDDHAERKVPDGYCVVPIDPDQEEAALRICVLFRTEPEKAGGRFVILRNMLLGRAILGCVVDSGGTVQDWVEIWLQDVSGLSGSPAVIRDCYSNDVADRQWEEQFQAARAAGAGQIVSMGWESRHPLPVFVDVKRRVAVHPCESKSGQVLQLCEDEALLAKKGLPGYRSSIHRYLFVPELGEDSPFVPTASDAPRNEATVEFDQAVAEAGDLEPLNPAAGLLHARRYSPIDLESFADVLGGGRWSGVFHGASQMPLGEFLRELSQASALQRLAEGHLLLGGDGQAGRLIEVFHLKLRLLADAVAAVRAAVRATQRPLLNVSADSFRVGLGEAGQGLPFLWMATLALAEPGEAVELPIEGSELKYYLLGRGERASIYRPASGQIPVRDRGVVRIRQTVSEGEDAIVVEGTLQTHERLHLAANDLLWMRLRLGSGSVDLYSTVDAEQAMATGEVRFRSVAQRFDDKCRAELKALEGVPVNGVPFEVVPLLSTPCDLYALGVLAARILLTHPQQSLPVALDELLSLARECAEYYDEGVSLAVRVKGIMDGDERWARSLGPHRLVHEEMTPEEAFSYVPLDLWAETLAMMVRMFPGVGPDSVCCDYGDAAPGGLHKVLEPAQNQLEDLLVRSRSLIVVDWAANREIHAVIRRCAVGLTEEGSADKGSTKKGSASRSRR
ncbi:MAG: hypothetical protein JSV91_13460 [Phycisphaerales bacterium]|nr:MAG: hypothetical protein JSV91_13460 [Phycisphaerales bacterium]